MRAPVVLVVLALVLAACGGSAPTAAPVQSAAPQPSGIASGAPPTPVAGGAGGDQLPIIAENIAFNPGAITGPADAPITLVLMNQDSGVPHDIALKDPSGATIGQSEIVTGPAEVALPLPALAAGTYTYVCTIHPNMTGTLTVE
jgi:plastocyanin